MSVTKSSDSDLMLLRLIVPGLGQKWVSTIWAATKYLSAPHKGCCSESVSDNFVFSVAEFSSRCGMDRFPVQLASSILSIGFDLQALSFSLTSAVAHLALGFLPSAFLPRQCSTAGLYCLKSRGCRHRSTEYIRFKCCSSESSSFVAKS